MTKKNSKKEMIPLNANPLMDFTVEELEQRLETDPLFLGNLFNLTDDSARGCDCKNKCGCDSKCEGDGCTCKGVDASCPDLHVGV